MLRYICFFYFIFCVYSKDTVDIHIKKLKYPLIAKQAGIEGKVSVDVFIRDNKTLRVKVDGEPNQILLDTVTKHIAMWTYRNPFFTAVYPVVYHFEFERQNTVRRKSFEFKFFDGPLSDQTGCPVRMFTFDRKKVVMEKGNHIEIFVTARRPCLEP